MATVLGAKIVSTSAIPPISPWAYGRELGAVRFPYLDAATVSVMKGVLDGTSLTA